MPLPKGTTDFHLEQLKSLRAEADEKLKELRANERYVLVGTGAVWAFMLATVHAQGRATDQLTVWADALGWWFPALMAVFGWWRSRYLVKAIDDLAGYIRLAEGAFSHPVLPGWQTYRLDRFQGQKNIGTTAEAFWRALFVITVAVGVLITRQMMFR